jgi:hypothetical protein
MTPTQVAATSARRGSVLTYRLDRAISNKGMGVAMPKLDQPGETAADILGEVEVGWVLLFSVMLLGLTLGGLRWSALAAVLMGATTALAYGLAGSLFDTPLGFWGGAAVVILPILAAVCWLVTRLLPGVEGKLFAGCVFLFGVAYPLLAGWDARRDGLYLNLGALMLLGVTAVQLVRRWPKRDGEATVHGAGLGESPAV